MGDGREEGRKGGRKEGREEGRKGGRKGGREEGREEGSKNYKYLSRSSSIGERQIIYIYTLLALIYE